MVRGIGIVPTSCVRSLISASRNSLYDNFEPHKARVMILFKMVRTRKCKNSSFFYFWVCLLKE
jgi:hypothetical protein